MRWIAAFLSLSVCLAPLTGETTYQKPPKEVLDVLHAPMPPVVSVSPVRTHVVLAQSLRYPPIAVLSQPMLRLAGLRINPRTNGPHNPLIYVSATVRTLADGREVKLNLPAGAQISPVRWSEDGKHFAFTNTTAAGIELWLCATATGGLRKVPGVAINAVTGEAVQWMPDNHTLLVRTVPAARGKAPTPPVAPAGPNVEESTGKSSTVRTYQDLLTNAFDETLLDYYGRAQLALVDTTTMRVTPVGKPDLFGLNEPSPDGKYILVSRIQRPYSRLHTLMSFPRIVEVWDTTGKMVHLFAKIKLSEPESTEAVPSGPRSYNWQPTAPSTLAWMEALDGGNPDRKAGFRDRLMLLKAPFKEKAVEIAKTQHRMSGFSWIDGGEQVIVREYDRNKRWYKSVLVRIDAPAEAPKQLWSLSSQDRYNDPGLPVSRISASGQRIVVKHEGRIYLAGAGASPNGDRPFLRRYDLATGATEELFRSAEDCYEEFAALVDRDGSRFLTRRETPTEPPNFLLHTANGTQAITSFKDPAPQLRRIKKQLVTYKRADGVPLSFTLYLPPDYKEGTRLPAIVWAYPREFNDSDTAGQVAGSTQRFTVIGGISHLFLLLQGYAILDNAAMPVVGDPRKANDTYVDQIVASAKAAIDKAAEMGVIDPERVGVGGHSYGAFMTANLLAHSDLFRTGIARSGAYNRTLTPFGFQNERRTLWQAPDVYLKMSPFMYANKIKRPILLIHGEADNNPGTFPIQSERMYQAIRGTGGLVRYVTLPHESHGYAARESVEHVLWEMITWFDKHVKNAPPLKK